jgi:hypothetical protein
VWLCGKGKETSVKATKCKDQRERQQEQQHKAESNSRMASLLRTAGDAFANDRSAAAGELEMVRGNASPALLLLLLGVSTGLVMLLLRVAA